MTIFDVQAIWMFLFLVVMSLLGCVMLACTLAMVKLIILRSRSNQLLQQQPELCTQCEPAYKRDRKRVGGYQEGL